MIELLDPAVVLVVVGFCAAEAVFLVALLRVFQPAPGAADPGRPEGARRAGFLERFGLVPGTALCFAVLVALTVCSALPFGIPVAVAGWWVAALGLFGLTVRQAFKANIALGLFQIALVAGIGAALSGP